MKIRRTAALLLAVLMISPLAFRAKAAPEIPTAAYEQYAAELSQCTGWKFYKNENTERYINYRLIHPDYTLDAIITYVNIGLDRLFYSDPVEIQDPYRVDVLVNKYRLLSPDFVPNRLETISKPYSYGTQKLTHDARLAFEKLCAAAKASGYPIWAVSSYRDYRKQAEVYDSFLNPNDPASAAARDLIAARPGFSEHQTGLAVDFSRVDASVMSAEVNKWMGKNAHKYGFIIRYPAGKEDVTGVTNEPWHLRYLGTKLATAVYNSGLTYDEYYVREIDMTAGSTDTTAIGVTASSQITVNGTPYLLSVYRVLGDTYYRLRDIAVILNGTPASFDLAWDNDAKRIELLQGVPYSSERVLGSFEAGRAEIVTAVKPDLQSGDTTYGFGAFVSGGSNYYRLDDVLAILGLTAADDGAGNQTINITGIDTVGTPPAPEGPGSPTPDV